MSKLKDLKEKLSAIDNEAVKNKNNLMFNYAMSESRFNGGDTLQSEGRTIIVDRILWGKHKASGFGDFYPHAVYTGKLLTKSLKPRKDGQVGRVYNYDEIINIAKGG